jgi:6-pyruvoyltetrahydropterin/6-carboxytetrahydropterin synthase
VTTDRIFYAAAAPFEAARQVAVLPDGHRSRCLHGHSFHARIRAALPADWAPFPGAETETLEEKLTHCVHRLDYRFLNEHIAIPTDENIARWIRRHLDVPGLETVGVLSTAHEGADVDRDGHVHIWRRFRIESAHQLPNVHPGHKCGRMHGHGFEIILHADQDLGQRDMGVDFDYLEKCWAPIHGELHHACLNDIPGLENPTSEIIAGWIWQRLKPQVPELSWVTVYETASAGCSHDGLHYRIWKELSLDSAVRLKRAPDGDARRRIHGHTFTLRLHLSAPLDEVMGWAIDYGDVKEIFSPVFKQLDHQPLYELEGAADTDPASLTLWAREQVRHTLPQLDRIDLYQTPGCGAILSWGELHPALPI